MTVGTGGAIASRASLLAHPVISKDSATVVTSDVRVIAEMNTAARASLAAGALENDAERLRYQPNHVACLFISHT